MKAFSLFGWMAIILSACRLTPPKQTTVELTRDKVRVASNILRKEKFLPRKVFLDLTSLSDRSNHLDVGKPHDGQLGISEIWMLEDGTSIKTVGLKSLNTKGDSMERELIDKTLSGGIVDDVKIFDIFIIDKSGKLLQEE